jgi:RNA polymerase sigma-70 factor (ECF subfamily)
VEIDAMNQRRSEALIQRSRPQRSPEQLAMDRDLRTVLERAISVLPPIYRTVLILRDVEGMNTAETADCLSVGGAVLKTRLHAGGRS